MPAPGPTERPRPPGPQRRPALPGAPHRSTSARLQLVDLRGNVVASTTIGGSGLDSFTTYTEYGTRKSANNIGGLTLMGARLYNPETGRFLSRDPVAGGNDNVYVYVDPPDPINKLDFNGLWPISKVIKTIVKVIVRIVKKIIKKTVALATKTTIKSQEQPTSKTPNLATKVYRSNDSICRTNTGYWHPNGCTPGVPPSNTHYSPAGTDRVELNACASSAIGAGLTLVGAAASNPAFPNHPAAYAAIAIGGVAWSLKGLISDC